MKITKRQKLIAIVSFSLIVISMLLFLLYEYGEDEIVYGSDQTTVIVIVVAIVIIVIIGFTATSGGIPMLNPFAILSLIK